MEVISYASSICSLIAVVAMVTSQPISAPRYRPCSAGFPAPEYNSYKVLRAAPGFQTKGSDVRQCVIGSDPPKKGSTVKMYNVVRVSIKL